MSERSWAKPTPFHRYRIEPFPIDALPTWLARYVRAEAIATQTPPDLAGGLALAVCAAALANKVNVRVRPGWREQLNLYVVTAMPSGSRKSAVFSHSCKPICGFEAVEAVRLEPEIARARTDREIVERRHKEAMDRAAKAKPTEQAALEEKARDLASELARMRVPASPRLIVDDCSPEKLVPIMRENGGRIACLSAEADVFALMAGRYSQHGESNLEVYLKAHTGDALRVDRIVRASLHVPHPALTLGVTVQPSVLRGLAQRKEFRDRGLLARLLYAVPHDRIGHRDVDPPPVTEQVVENYEQRVTELQLLDVPQNANGEYITRSLCLDRAAYEELMSFCREIEPKMAEFGGLSSMSDWVSKLPGAVVRIAGILHMTGRVGDNRAWEQRIDRETFLKALRLGRYYLSHARAAFAQMGADPVVEDAKRVLRWIVRHGGEGVSSRSIFQGTKGYFKTVASLEPAVALLVEHNYLRPVDRGRRKGPGRPGSQVYEVSPHAWGDSEDFGNYEARGLGSGSSYFEDIEDIEEEDPVSNSVTSEGQPANLEPLPQNSHNPQNADGDQAETIGPCPHCRGQRFWQAIGAPPVCARCHPPGDPASIAVWIGPGAGVE